MDPNQIDFQDPSSGDAVTQAAIREIGRRDAAIARFISVAVASNINAANTDFGNMRNVRENVVFKEATKRNMISGSAWVGANNVNNKWSLVSNTNMDSDQTQRDRSIIVRGVGLIVNPDIDIEDLLLIQEYGQATITSPNTDYLPATPPLEDLIITPVRQVSETNNKTASANGDGITAYELVRSYGQGKFCMLAEPLLIEKNSSAILQIQNIPGQTMTGAVTLQMVLLLDQPIV